MSNQPSPNFSYLAYHDARLVAFATQAEEVFASDPPTSTAKLRLFAEVLAKRAAAKVGLLPLPSEPQQTFVDRPFEKSVIDATLRTIFHDLRRAVNAVVHENCGDEGDDAPRRVREYFADLVRRGKFDGVAEGGDEPG